MELLSVLLPYMSVAAVLLAIYLFDKYMMDKAKCPNCGTPRFYNDYGSMQCPKCEPEEA